MSLMVLSNNKTHFSYNGVPKNIWIKNNTWNYSHSSSCLQKKIGMKGNLGRKKKNLCFCKSCPSLRTIELRSWWTLQMSAICSRTSKTSWKRHFFVGFAQRGTEIFFFFNRIAGSFQCCVVSCLFDVKQHAKLSLQLRVKM